MKMKHRSEKYMYILEYWSTEYGKYANNAIGIGIMRKFHETRENRNYGGKKQILIEKLDPTSSGNT